jgi:NAD(P)-dependent dehydrogenase (short-subunit alcohol dehydrogenase family)
VLLEVGFPLATDSITRQLKLPVLGIGAAVSEVLARKGAHVVLVYTSESSTDRTRLLGDRLATEYGIIAINVKADLATVEGPAEVVSTAKEKYESLGRKFQIDIIVNNAGISINEAIAHITLENFEAQYNTNVRGPLFLMKAALPYLPHDRSGRIVNVSSVSSSLGYAQQSVYGGTKAALEAMTRSWARELSERATVNAVNPGPVATDMYGSVSAEFVEVNRSFLETTPLASVRPGIDKEEWVRDVAKTGGRPATELEIAKLVGLLCSADASWTTGSVLNANGGMRFTA